MRAVKFFKENNERVRFLTEDEERLLAGELPDQRDWSKVEITHNTGLRRGEQFRLRWEHVDFGSGIITVPRSKSGETGAPP